MASWSIVTKQDAIDSHRLDPEFYRNDYLYGLETLKKIGSKKLKFFGISVVSGPFGSTLKSHSYLNKGVPFIRILDLKNFFIAKDQLVYISEYDNSRIKGSQLKKGDIIISKVGNSIGLVSILDNDFEIANISENNIGIKFNSFHESYFKSFILTYLNSFYGQNEILRRRSGNAQPKLNVADIYDLEIPIVTPEEQKEIEIIINKAEHLVKHSQNLYQQATELLDKELGLDTIEFEKPRSYTASFSEVIDFSRFDSEHYQPKFRKINKIVKNYHNGYERLLENIISVKPSYNLSQHPDTFIQYIELSKINPSMGYIEDIDKMNKSDAPSRAKRIVSTGDVIASSVVGSVDKAGLVSDHENGYIASNGFFQFRSGYYSPEFLLILIKSKLVKEQFHQQSTGGILSAVSDQNLKYLIIPKIDKTLQDNITSLVKDAHIKVRQSKQLLEQAKQRVEELIENAAGVQND